uniref:DNA N6-methyl adenine demethylase n=1 Tax=Caenorhabditis elegans TaxID=6239 RepID=UPI002ED70A02
HHHHHHENLYFQGSMGSAEQACGCKGARFCALCETTERVKKLRVVEDKHVNYKVFIYDHIRQIAIPTTNLNSQSSLEDIIDESTSCQSVSTDGSIEIDGLTLIHNFLSESEESKILNMIDTVKWAKSKSGRRKQDYGPKVNFKHKKVKTDTFVGMPEYADMLLNKMSEYDVKKLGNYQPFEMCNLEYEEVKKSAIEMHQDDMWIWGNRLISINLINGSVMTLSNDNKSFLCYVHMPHRSLLCMADECRYDWKHGVLAHHIRGRRIALTMREAAKDFAEGGELYEKYGAELIRLGNIRVPLSKTSV